MGDLMHMVSLWECANIEFLSKADKEDLKRVICHMKLMKQAFEVYFRIFTYDVFLFKFYHAKAGVIYTPLCPTFI